MEQQRFEETGQNSFYEDFLSSQVISKNYFLRQLPETILWKLYTKRLIHFDKGEEVS